MNSIDQLRFEGRESSRTLNKRDLLDEARYLVDKGTHSANMTLKQVK